VLAEPLSAFTSDPEREALSVVTSSLGMDPTRSFQFWESMVARITGGRLTRANCPWDVEIPHGLRPIRVEVKYAQESWMRFATGPRPVLKFAAPKGASRQKAADVVVFVGIDGRQDVHTWVLPARVLRRSTSITLTSPRYRVRPGRAAAMDEHQCPPTQLLPEVLRAYRCHLHYDRGHHAETRAATRRAEAEARGEHTLPGL
jgi:hypothetical protein